MATIKKLSIRQVNHAFHRFGFGASRDLYLRTKDMGSGELAEYFLSEGTKYKPLPTPERIAKGDFATMTDEERSMAYQRKRAQLMLLNKNWLDEMCYSDAFLTEKMALFWHDHFACTSRDSQFLYNYLEILRKNSTGNFDTMLREISRSAAMLEFLNNQQNSRKSPNENFAREVMELFTMGIGNYSEKDIKEAARAFTGWGYDQDGNYLFRKFHHDEGIKNVLGHSGNFNGDDILDILLAQDQTANYVCSKMYAYFIDEEQPDEEYINHLASIFRSSDYEIKPVIREILSTTTFYSADKIGIKIKSPIDFMAGLGRVLHVQYDTPETGVVLQQMLNQILLQPPNVAGWPGGKYWIDSSTILVRCSVPDVVFADAEWQLEEKDRGDDNNPLKIGRLRKFKTTVNWDKLKQDLNSLAPEELFEFVLQVTPDPALIEMLDIDIEDPLALVTILKLPEYQLC